MIIPSSDTMNPVPFGLPSLPSTATTPCSSFAAIEWLLLELGRLDPSRRRLLPLERDLVVGLHTPPRDDGADLRVHLEFKFDGHLIRRILDLIELTNEGLCNSSDRIDRLLE